MTVSIPADDRSLVDRATLANQLAASMAGRVAEQLVFGDVSTAGEDDIARTTRLARHMVTDWGMSERIGPVAAGAAGGRMPAPSAKLAALVDAEVAAAVRRAVQQAVQVLEHRRRQLDLVAERLLEAETIDRRALDHLLEEEAAGEPMCRLACGLDDEARPTRGQLQTIARGLPTCYPSTAERACLPTRCHSICRGLRSATRAYLAILRYCPLSIEATVAFADPPELIPSSDVATPADDLRNSVRPATEVDDAPGTPAAIERQTSAVTDVETARSRT